MIDSRFSVAALLFLLLASGGAPATAQPDHVADIFGVELELRGREVPVGTTAEKRFEDYRRILEVVVRDLGEDPGRIRKIEYSVAGPDGQPRPLMRAEFTDSRGRRWKVEPEWVTGGGRQQVDYELVTPKLTDPAEVERLVRALRDSRVVSEGLQSSVHIHVNGRGLIGPSGDATGVINLINLHERMEPLLRRLFAPVRGAGIFNGGARGTGVEGAYVNRFNRPLYLDHPDLLRELASLPEGERTRARVEELFGTRAEAEARAHGLEGELGKRGWKYRSLNLSNLLSLNPNLPPEKGSVEFRMNDLNLSDPATHALQVELYRALARRAAALAAEGRVVPAPSHRAVPAGENPATFLTSADPAEATRQIREMLSELGLDPRRYEPLIARNVRAPALLSESAFRERLAELEPLSGGDPTAIRIAVEEARLPLVLEVAERLAARTNLAMHLERVAHAGARRAVAERPAVTVVREPGAVVYRIDAAGMNRSTAGTIARLLREGTTRASLDGPGRPGASGSLAERARAFSLEVEGRALPESTLRTIDALEARAGGNSLLPLLAWANQPYLPPELQRDLRFRAERYLREVIVMAEAGATGEAEAEALRGKVRTWARETRLSDVLLRSLLPPPRPAAPRADRLAAYRRADGTLDWGRMTREGALREASGLAKFGLALFLKELAVVAQTGDRARIEEFFDGLATTDFYVQYGLFVAGARVGEVAYVRYLQRYVKPRFVSGVLKTNLVLATGLALPQIVGGTFDGRAFAISLTALGISSTAFRAGVRAIQWVHDLKKARDAGSLGRLGLRAGRLARIGGWFYAVAELAVVLYVADEIEERINHHLDLGAARDALADAGEALFEALGDPRADPDSVREAAERYHDAWGDYRNFLYRPLHMDEVLFAARLERVARRAKIKADERRAAVERLRNAPSLRRSIERRYGSLEAYAERRIRADEAEIARDVETATDSYNRARDAHLAHVYESNRRGEPLLDDVDHLDWLLTGGRFGDASDPFRERTDVFATWGRGRARSNLRGALEDASENRLEAYDDEVAVLTATRDALRRSGRTAAADALDAVRALAARTREVDRALYRGDGLASLDGEGLVGAVEEQ